MHTFNTAERPPAGRSTRPTPPPRLPRSRLTAVTLVACLAIPACSRAAPGGSHVGATPVPHPTAAGASPRSPLTVVGAEELRRPGAAALYESLAAVRPAFLRYRARDVTVFVDRALAGPVSALRMIRVADVKEIRLLKPAEAALVYGSAAAGGPALEVTLRRP